MTVTEGYDIAKNLGNKYLNSNLSRQLLVIFLILALIFGLIAFLFYNTTSKVQTLLNETVGLFNDTEIILPTTNLSNNKSLKESYIVYINIDNSHGSGLYFSSFGNNKPILTRKDDNFAIEYNP